MRAVIWIGLIVGCSALSATASYLFTKPHYFELGRNYGSIDGRVDLLRRIDATLPGVRTCPEDQTGSEWREIVSVKADAMYVKPIDDSSVLVCRAR
jgi:hypothetical protein